VIERLFSFHFGRGIRRTKWFFSCAIIFGLYALVSVSVYGQSESDATISGVALMFCVLALPAFYDSADTLSRNQPKETPFAPTVTNQEHHDRSVHSNDQAQFDFWDSFVDQSQNSPVICDAIVSSPAHRLVAAALDWLIVVLVGAICITLCFLFGVRTTSSSKTAALAFWLLLSLGGLYKTIFIFLQGATFGMQVVGLKIVNFDGIKPSSRSLAYRIVAGYISIMAFGIGVVWALVDDEGLTWHDHISSTFLTYASGNPRAFLQASKEDDEADSMPTRPPYVYTLPIVEEDLTLFSRRVVSIDEVKASPKARVLGARVLRKAHSNASGER
jgi:uncharacterized RDD family membrane protein YckC